MDHCLPGKTFSQDAQRVGRWEKQPLREIAIAANAALVGSPDGSGKFAFINSDVEAYHAGEAKESGKERAENRPAAESPSPEQLE